MQIKFKKMRDGVEEPAHSSKYAAGYDLRAEFGDFSSIIIKPGENVKIGTGIAVEIPDGYFGAIYARSGMATKRGLRPANCVGVIDSDYRGEIIVALHNDTDDVKTVVSGERIAQLVIQKYEPIEFVEVDELESTVRGAGGFGSTGE